MEGMGRRIEYQGGIFQKLVDVVRVAFLSSFLLLWAGRGHRNISSRALIG